MMRIPGSTWSFYVGSKLFTLKVDPGGILRDQFGTVWAMNDKLHEVGDPVVRCGIGIASLPEDHPLTDYCRVHDFQDSSPEFLAFHTNTEAAEYLRKIIKTNTEYSWIADPFYFLVQARNWLTGRLDSDANFKPAFLISGEKKGSVPIRTDIGIIASMSKLTIPEILKGSKTSIGAYLLGLALYIPEPHVQAGIAIIGGALGGVGVLGKGVDILKGRNATFGKYVDAIKKVFDDAKTDPSSR